ncbi:hypothetical protein AMAG_20175 [Allomyces macrogynus ATCC 38327]|uniref:Uncharacterized protein n=1 Tax=Allomyces macrogynus (strain ATCC 38327) TaxID=578462 RepID=A0A0L0T7K2_ALLM3|nr:hypothetical protein AMAG_20175 [Allomyces macrogynus ATCC 38327]|eukprot:KNE70788.1 hypothetical protein AMAG_20175 [Allomyces macrogynus ATCC 38327]
MKHSRRTSPCVVAAVPGQIPDRNAGKLHDRVPAVPSGSGGATPVPVADSVEKVENEGPLPESESKAALLGAVAFPEDVAAHLSVSRARLLDAVGASSAQRKFPRCNFNIFAHLAAYPAVCIVHIARATQT